MTIFRNWRSRLSSLPLRIRMMGVLPASLALLAFTLLFLGLRSVETYRATADREIAALNEAQQTSTAVERLRALAHEAFAVSVRGDVVRLKAIRQEFTQPLPTIYQFIRSANIISDPIELEGAFDLVLDAAEQLILGDVPASQTLMMRADEEIKGIGAALTNYVAGREQAVELARVSAGRRLELVSTIAGLLLMLALVLFLIGLYAVDRLIRRPLDGILSSINAIQSGASWKRFAEGEGEDEISRIHRALNSLADHETERRQTVERLDHLAHYDALTNLPNRVLLSDLINQEMLRLYDHSVLAIVIFDIDDFKEINDNYGHEQGDALLVEVSARLGGELHRRNILGRIGGDEFVVVLPEVASRPEAESIAGHLLDVVRRPLILNQREAALTACAGIAVCSEHDTMDSDQLLRHAEQALYQAKQMGANNYCVFDFEQQREIRGHHERIVRLEKALELEEFRLFYQPKVNLFTGDLIGVEALIRWMHPEKGLVSPALFLPDLDRHSLAVEVGHWVLNTAIRDCATWRRSGIRIPVAVNLFALQLQHVAFIKNTLDLFDRYPDLPPSDLELEIVETAALDDLKKTSQIIKACASHGLEFALDDFGTGYSSLTYLRSLPVKTIKLDQSFVRGMIDDKDDEYIIRGILSIAKAFGLKVVAEGVETVEHGVLLQQMGCEVAQGYAIARPMPFADVLPWLNAWVVPEAWRNSERVSGL